MWDYCHLLFYVGLLSLLFYVRLLSLTFYRNYHESLYYFMWDYYHYLLS